MDAKAFNSDSADSPIDKKMSNSRLDQRLRYIDANFYWLGECKRPYVVEVFHISLPQASTAFAEYRKRHPGSCYYDLHEKTYRASVDFKPLFDQPSLQDLLFMMAGSVSGQPWFSLAWGPAVSFVRPPSLHIDHEVIKVILLAMRTGQAVRAFYQSIAAPIPKLCTIVPRAIVWDGFRFLIRSFDLNQAQYSDFRLSQFISARGLLPLQNQPPVDTAWEEKVEIQFRPNSRYSEEQQRVIAFAYGMTQGNIKLSCRVAILRGFFNFMRFPLATLDSDPLFHDIEIANRAELLNILERSTQE